VTLTIISSAGSCPDVSGCDPADKPVGIGVDQVPCEPDYSSTLHNKGKKTSVFASEAKQSKRWHHVV